MITLTFKPHSSVGIITNSSTQIYTMENATTKEQIKSLVNTLLSVAGSSKTFDDLFEFNNLTWQEVEYNLYWDDDTAENILDAADNADIVIPSIEDMSEADRVEVATNFANSKDKWADALCDYASIWWLFKYRKDDISDSYWYGRSDDEFYDSIVTVKAKDGVDDPDVEKIADLLSHISDFHTQEAIYN